MYTRGRNADCRRTNKLDDGFVEGQKVEPQNICEYRQKSMLNQQSGSCSRYEQIINVINLVQKDLFWC